MIVDRRRHGGWHRSAEDAAFDQPLPLSVFINRVLQLKLVLTIQGLCDGSGDGREGTIAVCGKVGAIGWVDTDHRQVPPKTEIRLSEGET